MSVPDATASRAATAAVAGGAARDKSLASAVLLAFDTSTEALAVAVNAPTGRFTLMAEGGARASATLLPQVLRLLQQAEVRLQDLQAVAFGCGPGAFTGLRTACAVAQGLGLGLGLPLLPIDSLLIVAEDARQQLRDAVDVAPAGATDLALHLAPDLASIDLAVLMDARMQEVYAARYQFSSPVGWRVVQAPALYSLAAAAQTFGSGADQPQVHAGSALVSFGGGLTLPPISRKLPAEKNRAAALLQLALQAWAAGQAVDAALALPLYLRDKVAQTTAERLALQAAAAA